MGAGISGQWKVLSGGGSHSVKGTSTLTSGVTLARAMPQSRSALHVMLVAARGSPEGDTRADSLVFFPDPLISARGRPVQRCHSNSAPGPAPLFLLEPWTDLQLPIFTEGPAGTRGCRQPEAAAKPLSPLWPREYGAP